MKTFFDRKINRKVHEISVGEVISTNDCDSVLTTLLGSCVSVCLTDRLNSVFGMNHFMLPGDSPQCGSGDTRYGVSAIDRLVSQMVEKGANRNYLEAKVFGAGRVLEGSVLSVACKNAQFVSRYLEFLKIPVAASDLGKDYGRKIIFICRSGQVYVKKIADYKSASRAVEFESKFFAWLRSDIGEVCNE